MSFVSLLTGDAMFISGVEPDDDNELERVYLGPRYRWIYALAPKGSTSLCVTGHTFTKVESNIPIYQDREKVPARYLLPVDEVKS